MVRQGFYTDIWRACVVTCLYRLLQTLRIKAFGEPLEEVAQRGHQCPIPAKTPGQAG